MKISCDHLKSVRRELKRGAGFPPSAFRVPPSPAFTLIEIALCLAIIGFALLAVIIVLPYGMGSQRATREETIIGQDAAVLLENIRNGSHGADDLTNYVYAIAVTNEFGFNVGYYNPLVAGQVGFSGAKTFPTVPLNQWYPTLTNGANIIGLLSTPQYVYPGNLNPVYDTADGTYITNFVKACVRSISGSASEKPPQTSDIMVGDNFSYRIYCVNAPVLHDTNQSFGGFARQLAYNQREFRITFNWPLLPNGGVGGGRHTYRATIAGQLLRTNNFQNSPLYFYEPLSFSPAP